MYPRTKLISAPGAGIYSFCLRNFRARILPRGQDRGASAIPPAIKTIALPLEAGVQSLGRMLDQISSKLERYMDLLGARQKLVASNLANADTPGYQTKDLDFQSEFQSAVRDASPRAIEVAGLKTKNDGNNVSVDREARLLAENALRFNIASQLVRREIQSLRNAIQEGKSA